MVLSKIQVEMFTGSHRSEIHRSNVEFLQRF